MKLRLKTLSKTKVGIVKLYKVAAWFVLQFSKSTLLVRSEKSTFLLSSSTCQKGVWSCTEAACYGTCMIYGSGHYITFDGKFYDFDGSCEYVATQVMLICTELASCSAFQLP